MKTPKQIKALAKKIDKTLKADKDFKDTVYIEHLDGTKMELHYATYRKDEEWITIFTEHNGIFVYHIEDLEFHKVYKGHKRVITGVSK